MKISFILTLLASLLTMTACTSPSGTEDQSAPKQNTAEFDQSQQLTERYWKLIELEGEAITVSPNQEREAHFILKTEESRITGYTGCNTFFGTYTLKTGNRLSFAQLGSTKRACPDVELKEFEYLQVFGLTDNYRIRDDILELNVGRRAPLAVFTSVEL